MENLTKIILLGHGASGKDTIKNKLIERHGLSFDVSYTTRKPRIGEVCGTDYYFISENDMLKMASNDLFLQWQYFGNGYCYGTAKSEWHNKQVFIMTPEALNDLKKYREETNDQSNCIVIFLEIPEETRRKRMESRKNSVDNIDIRLLNDRKQFENFLSYNIVINDENISIEEIEKEILEFCLLHNIPDPF